MKKVKIKDICNSIYSGGTPLTSNTDYYNGNIPFLSISDINTKYIKSTSKYITNEAVSNCSTKIVKPNTLCLTIYATLGIPFITKKEIAIPQSVLALEFNNQIDLEYMYYLLLFNKKNLLKLSSTGTQPNLSKEIISNYMIKIHNNKIQQKIGCFDKELYGN